MEKIWETVTVTTKEGKVQIFEIVSSGAKNFPGLRAYGKGSEYYYEMSVFERGLGNGKAAKVERQMAKGTDIFEYDDLLQASK